MNSSQRSKVTAFLSATFSLVVVAGCNREPEMRPAVFEPNVVQAMKYEIKDGIDMDQVSKDATWVVHEFFGTPDEPKIPEFITSDPDLSEVVSMDNLQMAAGPESEGHGLYRQHCATCHGVTGNGRGETAAIITPYPRDYRMGTFKFKSTKRGSKPTREDLARAIREGIDGTAMKKIPELDEPKIQALVDYVIYLSIRGELERAMIDDAVNELDLADGDRILDTQYAESMTQAKSKELTEALDSPERDDPELDEIYDIVEDEEKGVDALTADQRKKYEAEKKLREFENYEESLAIINEDLLAPIVEDWLDAEDDVVEVPEKPEGIPVADNYEQFVEMQQGDQAEALAASIKRGQEIFVGKIASCSKCHGEKGRGDGQKDDFDDWTKDWTVRAGLKPTEYDSLVPLIARGALPPKNALPRDFAAGVYRGGESAEDLYRRITQGIEGTPMPAATFVPGQFEEVDVWHLINFIRSLQTAPSETPQETAPADAAKPAV
ncbi:cytochrome c [Stieleria varia]|uniref:Cytochrome c n=1 Tax=Stieleria varia TaxID=2528005 RepID=A0A5C6AZQ7_9BACT|nr:c-type cytochrome [Stieleria varia]TWU04602.1 Cytochrome c [Stieleria varia]